MSDSHILPALSLSHGHMHHHEHEEAKTLYIQTFFFCCCPFRAFAASSPWQLSKYPRSLPTPSAHPYTGQGMPQKFHATFFFLRVHTSRLSLQAVLRRSVPRFRRNYSCARRSQGHQRLFCEYSFDAMWDICLQLFCVTGYPFLRCGGSPLVG